MASSLSRCPQLARIGGAATWSRCGESIYSPATSTGSMIMQCQFINGCGIFTKVKGHEGAGPIFMHDLSIDQTAFSYFHMTQQARLLKQRKQLKVSDNIG